jgi:hypothetical protein
VNYEAWNRYVLIAIGLFAMFLYVGLLYAGLVELMSRLPKGKNSKKGSGDRVTARKIGNPKVSGR